ncbi:MAG: UPF0149 family protein [Proteobacteria bacterium]|nr:UPF0149 family protein [Pseudomonadota bacterium]
MSPQQDSAHRALDGPLSEAEIARLAERLAANPNPEGLSLEGVDGLFCALIASPTQVMPSEFLPVILGGEPGNSGVFADIEDAQATLPLLMRYWNSIAQDYSGADGLHLPYVEEPGTDGILGRDWARGFMKGTRLAPAGWDYYFKDEKEGAGVAIALVAGEIDPAWPKEPLSPEKRDELLQWMIAGAARAYRFLESGRQAIAEVDATENEPEPYVRPAAKVGRNDPCPCGSGQKFKKCCAAPPRESAH